jgi:hypothetical protein
MKKTTTPCSSLQGSSARERRYSSTAVGFPIRNDQKAHSQRVSEGFPSWVGARCAYTYVQGRENCVLSHIERLNKSITETHIRLAFDAFTPNERPQNCPRKPTQRPTKHHSTTQHQPTMHHSATHHQPTMHHSTTQHQPTMHHSTTQHQPTMHHTTTQHKPTMRHQTTHNPPTKLSWFACGLLTVHLGVT